MSKSVTDWHRKQRKKEIQKNKTARIAARDEKVKEEKTEQSVMEEIRRLERQFKNTETTPHAIKSKLDRLQKELKIVKEQAALIKETQSQDVGKHNKTFFQQQQAAFQPLENPAVSVYYDPVMNPFGAPPPGKPRLFHKRGGGVTMNLEEAGLVGEPALPPPPPPPPRWSGSQSQPATFARDFMRPLANGEVRAPPPPPPPPPPLPPPPPPPPPPRASGGVTMNLEEAGLSGEPALAPPPPPPPRWSGSQPQPATFARDFVRPLANGEPRAPPPPPPPPPPLPPHPPPPPPPKATFVKETAKTDEYTGSRSERTPSLSSKQTKKIVSVAEIPTLPPPSAAVERSKRKLAADIWASTEEVEYEEAVGVTLEGVGGPPSDQWWYRDTAGKVQGPFPTHQMIQWVQAGFFPATTSVQPSLDSPWKQLRNVKVFSAVLQQQQPVATISEPPEQPPPSKMSTVQDRIAALRREKVREEGLNTDVVVESSNEESSLMERIAALRDAHKVEQGIVVDSASAVASEQPTGSDEQEMNGGDDRGSVLGTQVSETEHTIAAREYDATSAPSPPPPPPPKAFSNLVDSAYPVEEFEGPAYPVDDDLDMSSVPYPVDNDYRVTDGYDDTFADDDDAMSHPVSGAYPVHDDLEVSTDIVGASSSTGHEKDVQPKKKKVKVDKELTAFLPSNIQKRRKA